MNNSGLIPVKETDLVLMSRSSSSCNVGAYMGKMCSRKGMLATNTLQS